MENALAVNFKIKSLLRYTLPSIVMMVVFSMYSIVDGMFISRFVGTDALAGVNIIFPVISVLIAVGIMIASGGSAVIAKFMGEKQNQKAKETFSMLIIIGLILSGIFMLFCLLFTREIAYLLGANDVTVGYAVEYGRMTFYFLPLALLQMLYQTFFVTAGKPLLGLILTFASGITNVILDYVFIVPANMGISGAALGTVIGYSIPAIVGTVYFIFNKKSSLRFVIPKASFKTLLKVFTNGSSEMVTNIAIAVTTLMFNLQMNKFLGADGIAAITIVQYMQFLLCSVYMGYSSGVAPIVSYKYGARDYEQQKLIFKISLVFIIFFSVVVFLFSELASKYLVLIFAPKISKVYEYACFGFLIFSVSYLFCGINIFASSYFTAFSNGKVSAFISFMRTLVFIIICLAVLPELFGVVGVWIAVPVAEFLSLFISIGFIVRYGRLYGYSLLKKDRIYNLFEYARQI